VSTPVGLRDLAVAWATLGVDDRTEAEQIASILGYELCAKPSPAEPAAPEPPPVNTPMPTRAAPRPIEPPSTDAPESWRPSTIQDDYDVVEARVKPAPLPSWWTQTSPLVHVVKRVSKSTGLLAPAHQDEVVETLARDLGAVGAADVDALVHRLARREPIMRLPRLFVRTMAYRLHVLVDRRTPMTPYRPDVDWLIARLRDLLAERLEVHLFASDPRRVGPRMSPREYTPPPPGSTVLVLSSLDAFAETTPWLELSEQLTRSEVPICVLCPYALPRISHQLRAAFSVYYWCSELTETEMVDLLDARRRLAR
jgi:hypothetical protein